MTPRKELFLLLTLAGVQFTHIMDFMIIMPLGPQLMRLFAINPREFAFLVSAYIFSAGLCGFLGAFLADRFDRKKLLLFAYFGFTGGTFACALAPNFVFLLLARSLAGCFGGVLGAQIMAIIGDAIPFHRRGRAMGLVMASFSIASVFGVPFGLYLVNKIDWHAPFLFVGAVALLLSAMIALHIPPMRRHMDAEGRTLSPLAILKSIASENNQLNALLLTILMMLSQFSLIPFLSPYMVANVGLREDQLPWIYFVGGGLTIFTSPVVGRLSDRYGKSFVFTTSVLLSFFPMLVLTHLGPASVPVAISLTTMFFIVNNGRFIPAMAMITSTVRPATRGSFMSINSSVQSLAAGFASFLAGLIVAKTPAGEISGYDTMGYIAAILSALAIVVGRRLKAVDE